MNMENIIKDKITQDVWANKFAPTKQKEEIGGFNPRKMLNRIYQRLFIMGWYEGTVPIFSKEKMGLSTYNKEGSNGR